MKQQVSLMRRREFLAAGAALATVRLVASGANSAAERIAGMTLAQLRDDFQDRLFANGEIAGPNDTLAA